jgi:uncharacterized protein
LEQTDHGVMLMVRAHAGARRNAVLGIRAGALRIAVTAAPEKGKANRAITELLAKKLGVSKSSIELVSGETAPQKRFLIVGASMDAMRAVLSEL